MEKARLNQKNVHRQVSTTSSPGENAAGTLPQAHKKHAKDMTKWSERGKEMRDDDVDATKTQQQPATATKATASGQPICVLCRRKFANVDKLRQHEKLSTLHKENLAKKAAASVPSLKLMLITNRGVKCWPGGFPETFKVDHWRCRFRATAGPTSAVPFSAIVDLMRAVNVAGLDAIKTENLCFFKNEDGSFTEGFSMGQGE